MPRYEQLEESHLDETQRRIWNDCKAGPRGSVPPPVHVWLKSPGLADNAHRLGAHVRFGTDFSQKLTEIAILMTARYWTAQFEWAAHVRLALNAHAGLIASRDWGLAHLAALADQAHTATGVSPGICQEYLSGLDYGLSYPHLAGLTEFYRRLVERGRIPNGTLTFLPAA